MPGDPEKAGLEFVNEIVGGSVPREFIPSVEKGFAAAMANGVLAGFTMDTSRFAFLMAVSTQWTPIRCPLKLQLVRLSVRLAAKPTRFSWSPS